MIRALELLSAVSRADTTHPLSSDPSTLTPSTPPRAARSPYFTPPRSGPFTRSASKRQGGYDDALNPSRAIYPPTPISPVGSPVTTSHQVPQGSEGRPRRSTRVRKRKAGKVGGKRKAKGGHELEVGHGAEEAIVAKSEQGHVEAIDKIHLIQERVRHDPWKMLVATCLLNVTSGRAARPIYIELMRRYPHPEALSQASIPDLVELLYPLGLFNQRAASLVRFSQEYLAHQWPLHPGTPSSDPVLHPTTPFALPTDTLPQTLDVRIFHGAGRYASDSFRIYSDLFPGKGGPEREKRWIDKQKRARVRRQMNEQGSEPAYAAGEPERGASVTPDKGTDVGDVEQIAEYLSDEEEVGEEEWRRVRPTDKELRRYLIWRWGLEGIVYDIHHGPSIKRPQDIKRLAYLT